MDIEKLLLSKMLEPRGRAVFIYSFVDANHGGNAIKRRSHTGIIMFIQNTPIIWFSKKHNRVEAAMFGSNLVALSVFKNLLLR